MAFPTDTALAAYQAEVEDAQRNLNQAKAQLENAENALKNHPDYEAPKTEKKTEKKNDKKKSITQVKKDVKEAVSQQNNSSGKTGASF